MKKINFIVKGLSEFTIQGYEKAAKKFNPLPTKVENCSVIITGSNSGIGKAALETLAKKNAEVHLVCRNQSRGEAAVEDIKSKVPDANIHMHILDVSDLESISKFVDDMRTKFSPTVLVNNAGCMVHGHSKRLSKQNFEVNTATNTIGTYLLTKACVQKLEKLERVITVSSGGMYTEALLENYCLSKVDDVTKLEKDATQVYAKNKRQQVVFTEELGKSYPKIQFTTMHPGWSDTPAVREAMPDFHKKMEGKWRTPEQGADTIVYLSVGRFFRIFSFMIHSFKSLVFCSH